MINCKEIEEYLRYVEDNPKKINRERSLLIKNIVLPTLRRNDVFFDEKTYQNCLKYCEKHYYKFFPYQKFIYAFAFMYVDDRPVFRKFFIMMGRGNGKDGFIVPLVNFFQTPLYGVKNYHVEIVANSEQQVKDTFKVAYDAMNIPAMKGKFKVTKELITNTATGSEMKYNTSNAATKDGKRPGCLVLNEIHAYENYDQINVFESAFGKVKHAREFILTTNGYVREGPMDELLDLMEEILETGENQLGYFPFICKIDGIEEADDRLAWHKPNPSMEYMPILEHQILQDYLEMKKLPSKRPEFMTKRMNWPDRNDEATVASWENILRCCYSDIKKKTIRETPDTQGRLAVIGIDYADVRDFASAGVLTEKDGEYIWRQHTWICEESPFLKSIKFPIFQNMGQPEFSDYEITPGQVIPPENIVRWCMDRMNEYYVLKITMDTYRYRLFKMLFESYGIREETKKDPYGQMRLIRKIGSVCGIIAPEIEKLFAEGRINYGASAIMRWYTNNTEVLTDRYGNKQYGKIEPKLRKNDGFMAFLVSMYSKDLIKEKVIYV
ncbi:terminase large subunit domain-containing protein [Sellimonas intestinalis]|uniref:terminase large subunit domain-containing protein n=1 Tax=Sellimonas intestinalis TaxID=1653434 RepID=UPI0006B150B3|nr:terminase large subunit [Sellimonas intestinalis]